MQETKDLAAIGSLGLDCSNVVFALQEKPTLIK